MRFSKKLFVLPLLAGMLGSGLQAPASAQAYTYERTSSYEAPYTINRYVDDPVVISRPMLMPAPFPDMESRVISQPVLIDDGYRRPVVIHRRYYGRGVHVGFPFGDLDLR